MNYTDIKTKIVEEVLSEEQFYTLKELLIHSYLFMDKSNRQEVKELLLNVFNISEQELIGRSSSFHKHGVERATLITTIETAEQWIEKSNVKDVPALLELTHTDLEIVGQKGSISGSHHLADWLDRANLQLETLTRFAKGHNIVLEQQGTWYDDNGEIRGQATVYTFMRITEGKVVFIARYDNKKEAFQISELSEEDKIN